MEFTEYLIGKKIDPEKFRQGDPQRYNEFRLLFEQMHPKSFTAQKLYLINPLRLRFHLENSTSSTGSTTKPSQPTARPRTVKPSKPVTRPGTGTKDDSKVQRAKPAMKPRPIPKKKDGGEEKNDPSKTPARAKPVIRPKSTPSGDKSEEEKEPSKKPARSKPVIRPKNKEE